MRDLAIALTLIVILSMHVYYDKDVKVVLKYDLDGAENLAYVFGTENIKKDVLGIFKSDDYKVVRIDFHEAIIEFNTTDFGDYFLFKGVELEKPVNMKLHINGFAINLTSDYIPQAYIFE